jgi:hypothetical protein
MTVEAVVLLVVAVNAAVCAAVPAEVKAKSPRLWAMLDALALNVRHATNRLQNGATWQQAVSAAVVGVAVAVATTSGGHAPAPEAAPQTVADAPTALPADVSPCAVPSDATVAAEPADATAAEVQ